jgi:hypothetical protein
MVAYILWDDTISQVEKVHKETHEKRSYKFLAGA